MTAPRAATTHRRKAPPPFVEMSYWRAPAGSLETPEAILPWAEAAVAAARRAAAAKTGRKAARRR